MEESPDSSWGEASQKILFESELTGKGYQKAPLKVDTKIEENKAGYNVKDKGCKDAIFKNVGFVNYKWTEILVEVEAECEELEREEVKKAIIQLSKREQHNSIEEGTDKYIRSELTKLK